MMVDFQKNLETIERRLCALTSRPVRLIAVSKMQPIEAMRALYDLGVRDFGENYVQEWEDKYTALKDHCPEIRWHFIGQLQRNKVQKIVGRVALIHSVSSEDLLARINRVAEAHGVVQPILLQVNVRDEPTKAGFSLALCRALASTLSAYQHVSVRGLMTFPSPNDDSDALRAIFDDLARLKGDIYATLPSALQAVFTELSMGTTEDWPIAVSAGATLIRLGTSVFGKREG